jgi:hypothetical protein
MLFQLAKQAVAEVAQQSAKSFRFMVMVSDEPVALFLANRAVPSLTFVCAAPRHFRNPVPAPQV